MCKPYLDLYTDYLISSFGPTTATGLARLLGGEVSHDQVTRFLASEEKRSADLWREVKPLVRQVESEDGVLIIDDSSEEKPYTDENELICWHWDNSQRRVVKGINFLTALYQVGEVALPLAFDLVTKTEPYTDPKTGRLKRRSQISKNARYRMLVAICVHNQVKFRYVINDLWYASSDNMKYLVHTLKKQFVMPLKENRKVALSQQQQRDGQFVAVNGLELPEGTTREIWLEEVDFPVLLAKQVFTNEDGSTGVRYLVTSDLTLSYDRITALYHRRWSVEVYHKSLKQNASLEKSPTRTETTGAQSFLCQSVCLPQAGTAEARHRAESFRVEVKDLLVGGASSLCRACQTQIATARCVTSEYKLSLILAHQHVAQLTAFNIATGRIEDRVSQAIFGNVGTMIAFRLGVKDALFMAQEMGKPVDAEDLENLKNYHAIVKTLIDGEVYPPFTIKTLLASATDRPEIAEKIRMKSLEAYGVAKVEAESEIRKRAMQIIESSDPAEHPS